ncbi:TPA: 50S ribosomal protein L22 [Candidatus Dependentiae bacterium]|nr:MAG: 50S ribosomal protein L22 [candidate division TM6 bacterium GW2011_GWF2_43_87]HBL98461.1 50S ribosomal protein L22 [Candidatus Dependentiae bacterium]
MQFKANSKYVWYSPYKLRPLADVIRGKNAVDALKWLTLYGTKRSIPLRKTLVSAVANAKDRENLAPVDLIVCEVRIDQGPIREYHKPGAQGRAMPQRSRQSHILVVVESKKKKEA